MSNHQDDTRDLLIEVRTSVRYIEKKLGEVEHRLAYRDKELDRIKRKVYTITGGITALNIAFTIALKVMPYLNHGTR